MNIGDSWKNWKIEALLGEGTFGKVYKISRTDFGHTYESALKVIRIPPSTADYNVVLNDSMSEERAKDYFYSMVKDIVSEFALMSDLRGDSNIVSYEDHEVVEREDGFGWEIFIRMELLTPLFDYLRKNTYTIRDVIRLGIDICKAIEVCQDNHIIHRDIKPENIFLSKRGLYKLGDFGIARQMEKTSSEMSKKGTPSYMAPEVYKCEPYNSTVDIYSLGIVMYRFLNNNRNPFMPPYPEKIHYSDKDQANGRRLTGQPMDPPCNSYEELSAIVLKACAYDPNERYRYALSMRRDLTDLLDRPENNIILFPIKDLGQEISSMGSAASKFTKLNLHSDPEASEFSIHSSASEFSAAGSSSPLTPESSDEDKADDELTMTETFSSSFSASSASIASLEAAVASAKASADAGPEDAEDSGDSEGPTDAGDTEEPEVQEEAEPGHDAEAESEAEVVAEVDNEAEVVIEAETEPEPEPQTEDEPAYLEEPEPVGEHEEADGSAPAEPPEAAAAEAQKHEEKKAASTGTSTRPGPGKGAKIAIALLAAIIIAIPIIMISLKPTVPDVLRMDAEDAKAAIEDAGFVYAETREFSDVTEAGKVTAQTHSGEKLKKGSTVDVVISRGKAIELPDLKGKNKKDAEAELSKLGLTMTSADTQFSDTIEKDCIISQDPEAGFEVGTGDEVKVVVSSGITQVTVPDVTGMTEDEANKTLKEAGLTSTSEYSHSSSVESGKVISQSVEVGKQVDKNSGVTITVSTGPQPQSSGNSGSGSKSKSKSKKSKKSKKKTSDADWS